MSKGVFITGTDTGVGKTRVTLGIMSAIQSTGLSVCGMKPLASGASEINGVLLNEDARSIQRQASKHIDYQHINPYVYQLPIAPHLAAEKAGECIDIDKIIGAYKKIGSLSDYIVVEGVGGWRVPVNNNKTLADLVRALKLPVIIVVGIRLGCINHALLSAEAIKADGLTLFGWVANRIDKEYMESDETIRVIAERIAAPKLADIPFLEQQNNHAVARLLNPEKLM